MNVLGIDTSSAACVLGLQTDAGFTQRNDIVGREHSRVILPTLTDLLEEANVRIADINLIVMGQGPGSFTGLRIGVGVVQGLAFGLDIPVAPVSTLACIARRQMRETGATHVLAALHARKDEVYFGAYAKQGNLVRLLGSERVASVRELVIDSSLPWVGAGDGWQLQAELEARLGRQVVSSPGVLPQARDLVDLGLAVYRDGGAVPSHKAEPRYLREHVADRPKPRAKV